jgi:hypothetical protein
MSFDTGIEQPRIKTSLEKFQTDGRVVFFPASNCIILVNFIKNQSINTNMKAGIEALIEKFPDEVKAFLEQHLGKALEGFESLSNALRYFNLNLNLNLNSNSAPESERGECEHSDPFEKFWKAYPNKVEKKKALEKWKRIKPDASLLVVILDAIKAQIKWRENANGEFRPEWKHPTTWLNGECWLDEVGSTRASPPKAQPYCQRCKKRLTPNSSGNCPECGRREWIYRPELIA